jgi:membrane protein insertase Oxa1/YidC/SpoIIIJ
VDIAKKKRAKKDGKQKMAKEANKLLARVKVSPLTYLPTARDA